jgi:aryl-alcohol dehydrogenase-like predicted oxidoreductase
MKHRTLGETGIHVSEIGLGAWELGGAYFLRERSSKNNDPAGYDDVAEDEAVRTIHWGLEHGLTFVDTAPIYGDGESERRVARALTGRREPVTVETKLCVFASTVIAGSANQQQLEWNMAASGVPPLTPNELARVRDLQENNFGVPVG